MPATYANNGTQYYSATFTTGRVTRTSASGRAYTHAWLVTYGEPNASALANGCRTGGGATKPSFAGSNVLAYQAANNHANKLRRYYTNVAIEVVPVTVHATRKEALGR